MKFENLLNKILPYLVIALALATLMGVDYSEALGDIYRGGRIRYLLMAFAVCQFIYLRGINPWWAAFSAWSFFLWCLNGFSGFGAADVALIPACLLIGDLLRRFLLPSTIFRAVAYMAAAQGLYGCLQWAGFDPLFPNIEPGWKRVAIGTFGHNTLLAPFLALGAVYFASKWKWVWALALSIQVVVTGSSMGIGALLAGLLYVLWRFSKGAAYAVGSFAVAGLLGGYLLAPSFELFNPNGRFVMWPNIIPAIMESPIIGHGPGSFMERHELWGFGSEQAGMMWHQLHQEYLQALVETGLVGLVLVFGGLFYALRTAQRIHPMYGAWLVVLAVNSLANFTMHFAAFGLIAGWLAAVLWQTEKEQ